MVSALSEARSVKLVSRLHRTKAVASAMIKKLTSPSCKTVGYGRHLSTLRSAAAANAVQHVVLTPCIRADEHGQVAPFFASALGGLPCAAKPGSEVCLFAH